MSYDQNFWDQVGLAQSRFPGKQAWLEQKAREVMAGDPEAKIIFASASMESAENLLGVHHQWLSEDPDAV